MHAYNYPTWTNHKTGYGPVSPTIAAPCEACVEPIYPTMHVTSQCTDQCVVIACSDPHHSEVNECHRTRHMSCDLVCDGSANCSDCDGFDEFLQCCTNYHSYLSEPRHGDHLPNVSLPWDSSLDDFFCSSCPDTRPVSSPLSLADQSHFSGAMGSLTIHSLPSIPLDTAPASLPAHYGVTPEVNPSVDRGKLLTCMWGDCKAKFSSLSELVGHVNVDHLRLPVSSCQDANTLDASQDIPKMSCQWRDCNIYPSESIPTSSTGDQANEILNFLTNHLLYDHLGITDRPRESSSFPDPESTTSPGFSSESNNLVPTSPSADAYKCQWRLCGKFFNSNDLLTQHINGTHIGAGKAHYECFWEGCERNGNNGFGSKQKICRHIQSHTGHRPFQCKTCHQYFSEAATLQQHMRRHTQEKPYTCDYPGCGKTFAITGALTIHKRVHNGQKPFKCKFCDRAFSESSNLSKHLRTHTGARPYCCTEPGCTKSFARPDQLTRHLGVHRKKTPEETELPRTEIQIPAQTD